MPYYPTNKIDDESEVDSIPYDMISNKEPMKSPNEAMSVKEFISQKFASPELIAQQNDADLSSNLGRAFQSFSRGVNAPQSNDALYANMDKQTQKQMSMVEGDINRAAKVKEAIANRSIKEKELDRKLKDDERDFGIREKVLGLKEKELALKKDKNQIQKPDIEMALRKEWDSNQTTQDTQKLSRSMNVLRSVKDTPAGHLSFIYNYMKMLDPGSTVRESEFATAAKAGDLGDKFQNLVSKVSSGKLLTPEQIANFKSEADAIYTGQLDTQKEIDAYYKDIARKNGFNPDSVVIGFKSKPVMTKQPETTPLNSAVAGEKRIVKRGYNPKTDQTQFVYSDGTKEVVNGKK